MAPPHLLLRSVGSPPILPTLLRSSSSDPADTASTGTHRVPSQDPPPTAVTSVPAGGVPGSPSNREKSSDEGKMFNLLKSKAYKNP
uniref:Uncharacterized protein n=1 Tax=Sphaerodactylus townsendi TaxID=933632 RepID=A0ACB8GC64_9SAUR